MKKLFILDMPEINLMEQEKDDKDKFVVSERVLLAGEKLAYNNGDLIITDKRIIKHKTGKLSHFSEFFSEDYQDMDIKRIVCWLKL